MSQAGYSSAESVKENDDDLVSYCSKDSWATTEREEEAEEQEQEEEEEKRPLLPSVLKDCKNPLEVGKTLRDYLETPEKIQSICQMLEGMRSTECTFTLLNRSAYAPQRATEGSVGYDLFAVDTTAIPPYQRRLFNFGLSIKTPGDYLHCEIKSRSGLACRKGIEVVGSGLIDTDYTGAISAMMENRSDFPYTIYRGDRIAQLVFRPYINAKLVHATLDALTFKASDADKKRRRLPVPPQAAWRKKRFDGGFGSTGK